MVAEAALVCLVVVVFVVNSEVLIPGGEAGGVVSQTQTGYDTIGGCRVQDGVL